MSNSTNSIKCKCGASIPADSQFCPDCGKKANINNIDKNKWIDSNTFYQQKKSIILKRIKIVGIPVIIIWFICTQDLDHFIPFSIFVGIPSICFLLNQIFLLRKINKITSGLTLIEKTNTSIIITKNYSGKYGLYKYSPFHITELLESKYDNIELIGRNAYKIYEKNEESIYNVATKKITTN